LLLWVFKVVVKQSDKTGARVSKKSAVRTTGPEQTTGAHCPICKKPAIHQWRPFCSKRCSELDLGKWLSGGYVISGQSADDDEDGVPFDADMNAGDPE